MKSKRATKTDLLQRTLDCYLLRILSQESLHGYAAGITPGGLARLLAPR